MHKKSFIALVINHKHHVSPVLERGLKAVFVLAVPLTILNQPQLKGDGNPARAGR
ncbi:hypothetical protein ACZ87_03130 [Candidatus Erwinia dacicola]|uniref:Uncharacterized protein n=1 Tax=Candidatus Erwinia dacicola TaxID=252393 RepID=A0A328TL02_9GAMM|nr:hypothetical protein ACZ87_03130 [Candidatus Erwinia dacicola]